MTSPRAKQLAQLPFAPLACVDILPRPENLPAAFGRSFVMQTYDLVMLAVLGGATIFGFWKGLAWQVASLASLVVSYFVALRFADRLAPMVSEHAPLNKFIAMLIIYAVASLAIWMIFRVVAGVIDGIKLKEFDRQMGALVGFAKGVLLCVGITFFAVTLAPAPQGQAIANSQSGHYIVALLDKAHSVFPPELHQTLDPYLNTIEQRLNPNYQPHGENLQQMWQNQVKANMPSST